MTQTNGANMSNDTDYLAIIMEGLTPIRETIPNPADEERRAAAVAEQLRMGGAGVEDMLARLALAIRDTKAARAAPTAPNYELSMLFMVMNHLAMVATELRSQIATATQ